MELSFKKYKLDFNFPAGTSRGVMTSRDTWFLFLKKEGEGFSGTGEAAPLPGLSPEDPGKMEERILLLKEQLQNTAVSELAHCDIRQKFSLQHFPSLVFALETAILDLRSGGKRFLFDTPFSRGQAGIPINGLIWMGSREDMVSQAFKKISLGFTCIKMKIGAIDFNDELEVLGAIRRRYPSGTVTLRVDANGAFAPEDVMNKMEQLSAFDLHSIEQPLKPELKEEMSRVCRESPVPVALDEQLIGVEELDQKKELIDFLKPAYLILKPSLHGGLSSCSQWIDLAEANKIGWWITSALESNVGLNAISQFTSTYAPQTAQGLGTGQLFTNNIKSPLVIHKGNIWYEEKGKWDQNFF